MWNAIGHADLLDRVSDMLNEDSASWKAQTQPYLVGLGQTSQDSLARLGKLLIVIRNAEVRVCEPAPNHIGSISSSSCRMIRARRRLHAAARAAVQASTSSHSTSCTVCCD